MKYKTIWESLSIDEAKWNSKNYVIHCSSPESLDKILTDKFLIKEYDENNFENHISLTNGLDYFYLDDLEPDETDLLPTQIARGAKKWDCAIGFNPSWFENIQNNFKVEYPYHNFDKRIKNARKNNKPRIKSLIRLELSDPDKISARQKYHFVQLQGWTTANVISKELYDKIYNQFVELKDNTANTLNTSYENILKTRSPAVDFKVEKISSNNNITKVSKLIGNSFSQLGYNLGSKDPEGDFITWDYQGVYCNYTPYFTVKNPRPVKSNIKLYVFIDYPYTIIDLLDDSLLQGGVTFEKFIKALNSEDVTYNTILENAYKKARATKSGREAIDRLKKSWYGSNTCSNVNFMKRLLENNDIRASVYFKHYTSQGASSNPKTRPATISSFKEWMITEFINNQEIVLTQDEIDAINNEESWDEAEIAVSNKAKNQPTKISFQPSDISKIWLPNIDENTEDYFKFNKKDIEHIKNIQKFCEDNSIDVHNYTPEQKASIDLYGYLAK